MEVDPSLSADKRPADTPFEGEDASKRLRLEQEQDVIETPSVIEPIAQPDTTTKTVMHNGISIPADSALFASIELPQRTELSPLVLMKANLASLPLSLQAHDSLPIRIQFAINSVPLLDNVATQILRLIGVGPYEETLAIITNEEPTPEGLVYRDLVELFEQIKRIYSEEDPFLDLKHIVENTETIGAEGVKNLKDIEDTIDSALRKANLATFLLATLGSIEVGFFFLNEFFLDVFCPSSSSSWFKSQKSGSAVNIIAGKLLKAQAGLFLELKTQAYISALESGSRSKEEILDDIFPDNIDQMLLERRQSTQLTPAEQDFIIRCKSRRDTLLSTPDDQDLSESYDWLIFLKELFNHVSKNIGSLLWGRKGRNTFLAKFNEVAISETIGGSQLSGLSREEIQKRLDDKIKEEEERQIQERDSYKRKHEATAVSSAAGTSSASGSSSGPPRLRNIMRRPWTPEEESALVEALEGYGPHWAKILEFYGPGGKVNEALKGRTQVQLKDKARNWKMSYLKNGKAVPHYLQKVTGELERDQKVAIARRTKTARIRAHNEALKGAVDKTATPTPTVSTPAPTATEAGTSTPAKVTTDNATPSENSEKTDAADSETSKAKEDVGADTEGPVAEGEQTTDK